MFFEKVVAMLQLLQINNIYIRRNDVRIYKKGPGTRLNTLFFALRLTLRLALRLFFRRKENAKKSEWKPLLRLVKWGIIFFWNRHEAIPLCILHVLDLTGSFVLIQRVYLLGKPP